MEDGQYMRYAEWHKRTSISRFLLETNAYRLTMEGDAKQRPSFIEYDWFSKEILSYQKVLPYYPGKSAKDLLGYMADKHNEMYVLQANKLGFANRHDPEFGYDYTPRVYIIYFRKCKDINPCSLEAECPDIDKFWVRRLLPNSPDIIEFSPRKWASYLAHQRSKWQEAYLKTTNKARLSMWLNWLKKERGEYTTQVEGKYLVAENELEEK